MQRFHEHGSREERQMQARHGWSRALIWGNVIRLDESTGWRQMNSGLCFYRHLDFIPTPLLVLGLPDWPQKALQGISLPVNALP